MDLIKTVFEQSKVLFAEALDNLLVAGSCMFLILSFFTAIAEPKAALLTLAIGVAFYAGARLKDQS